MLNLEDNLIINNDYTKQQDFYIKGCCYSTSVVIIVEIIRGQVPEVNLLQLIPGFYLLLLFTSFLLLIGLADFYVRIPINLEIKKSFGTKSIAKLNFSISTRLSIFLFFFIVLLSLNTVIPVSLDSFNTYGEKTLENIWSFNEVLNLETVLLFILISVSQIPTGTLFFLREENDVNILLRFWKLLTLFIFIFSGFLTPTIDGYTQISFSASAFSVYLIIINFLQKRVGIKFTGSSIYGY